MKCIRISSSIANFRGPLMKRYSDYKPWDLLTLNKPTLFFGLYNIRDYLCFLLHRGPKTVFWCGSDIKALKTSRFLKAIVDAPAKHICENITEIRWLANLGIISDLKPMIFDDPMRFKVSFVPSKEPHVFLCAHKDREDEYGIDWITSIAPLVPWMTFHIYGVDGVSFSPNVIYHGNVPNIVFEREINSYQGAIRLNEFDGASEVMTKSILLGQYPITRIFFPFVDQVSTRGELIHKLIALRDKIEPNPYRLAWQQILCNRVEA